MNETEAYGKYGQGYIYPNNGMYHAGFITDEVIDDIKEVWEEEGRPDGDLKTFIENNSYDLDLDEDGETVYGYDFASFDEAKRWVNQQLKSSRNASKKRKTSKKPSMEMMPKSQWENYLGPGDHDDIDRLYADRSDPDSFLIIDTEGRMTVFGPDDPDHFDPDSWAML